jgi:hypothetical protein
MSTTETGWGGDDGGRMTREGMSSTTNCNDSRKHRVGVCVVQVRGCASDRNATLAHLFAFASDMCFLLSNILNPNR